LESIIRNCGKRRGGVKERNQQEGREVVNHAIRRASMRKTQIVVAEGREGRFSLGIEFWLSTRRLEPQVQRG